MGKRDVLYVNKSTVMRTGLEKGEEPKVKREFIVSPATDWNSGFMITDMRYTSLISGGPIVAIFYEEELAKEYAEFKNNQLHKK